MKGVKNQWETRDGWLTKFHGGWTVVRKFDDFKYPYFLAVNNEGRKVVIEKADEEEKLNDLPKFVRKFILAQFEELGMVDGPGGTSDG